MSVLDQETEYCFVQMWTVVDGKVREPARILGRTTWTELEELVTKQGGRRLTYDLFDVPNPDGTTTRYRATENEVTW